MQLWATFSIQCDASPQRLPDQQDGICHALIYLPAGLASHSRLSRAEAMERHTASVLNVACSQHAFLASNGTQSPHGRLPLCSFTF
jgi:hypothetical protein